MMHADGVQVPCGKRYTWGAYIAAYRRAKTFPPEANLNGWNWWPTTAAEVLRDMRAAINDRVNQRGGVVMRECSLSKLLRAMNERSHHKCGWCGKPLFGYRLESARFCDAGCGSY